MFLPFAEILCNVVGIVTTNLVHVTFLFKDNWLLSSSFDMILLQ